MSQKERKIELNELEIRALYAQGEEVMVSWAMKLLEQVEKLELRIEELEGRAKKTSGNSSKPPSGEEFGKKIKSLRSKSDREAEGQKVHQGQTLEWSDEVDEVERHQVRECLVCGEPLAQVPIEMILHRQVLDMPPMQLRVKEHQVEVKCCRYCGQSSQGSFPAEASNVVQYGSRLKAMMVYLMEGQLLPSKRSCEVLSDLLGVNVSQGTMYTTRTQCFEHLELIEEHIQATVANSKVVHFDETRIQVNGRLW